MAENFAYTLNDLEYWLVELTDGTVVKYMLDAKRVGGVTSIGMTNPTSYPVSNRAYTPAPVCRHDAKEPIFVRPEVVDDLDQVIEPEVRLFICDAQGARDNARRFDIVIDGGDVLWNVAKPLPPKPIAVGDDDLVAFAAGFATNQVEPIRYRLLQIDWKDRQAPPLDPRFWPALASRLSGDVMTCCQGGHGRSGTSLVSLVMCYTDYTPLDAITHIRAVHCPRAIESDVQHAYLDHLARVLGREENAIKAKEVKSFKDRFLNEMTSLYAKPWQDLISKPVSPAVSPVGTTAGTGGAK